MKKKKWIIIGSIIGVFLILISCFLLFNKKIITLTLKGKEKVTIPVFDPYKEEGSYAKAFGFTIPHVMKKGKVDTKKIGTYPITYSFSFLWFQRKKVRTIEVVDKESPVITLNGEQEVTLSKGEDYQETGYEVTDNYDKDLKEKVKVNSNVLKDQVGSYEILYEVEDSSHNKASVVRKVNVVEQVEKQEKAGTYINGILIVNKKYSLPANYNPGVDKTASLALSTLQQAAKKEGYSIPLISGFRSYNTQKRLYNNYVARDGEALANTYSAKPGQSEHQTGLAFDVGKLDNNYGETKEGIWLKENAHRFGFIIRYLKGKEDITGYQYEPWHIRYVGESIANEIYQRQITLEEYLGVN